MLSDKLFTHWIHYLSGEIKTPEMMIGNMLKDCFESIPKYNGNNSNEIIIAVKRANNSWNYLSRETNQIIKKDGFKLYLEKKEKEIHDLCFNN